MIKQKIMLVMPPGWDITQPYLALPQLKGYVNTLGHDLDIFDDNICFFDTILSEEYVTPILDEVINEFHKMDGGHIPFDKEQYNTLRLIRIYESAIREIEKSKRILKSTIDPKEEKQHFRIMSAALSAVSYYYHMSIAYDHVDSKKYDTKTIDGLLEFSLDSENNVYYEYYSSGKGRELILRSLQYEHVGLSITSRSQLLSALTFAILLKKEKNPPIIHFGGSFITRMAAYIHEDTLLQLLNNVDFLLLYEGEVVLEQLFNGIPYVRCTNVIYHDNTHIRRNEKTIFSPKEFIIPNFDGLDLSIYFSPRVSLPLVSSRGCYSNCAFCTIPQGNSSKKYHVFKIQDIIDAIHYLKYKYNTEYFTFNDETFNLKRMVNFSKAVASENIHWIAETRFDERLTDE